MQPFLDYIVDAKPTDSNSKNENIAKLLSSKEPMILTVYNIYT